MANDLLTQQEGRFLALMPRDDQRAAAILRSCLSGSYREFGALMMHRPPEGDSRAVLSERLKALTDSLASNKKEIALLVRDMLLGYRHKGVRPDEDAAKIVALYCHELTLDPKIPTWAVWKACSAIRTGGDPGRLEKVGIRLYEAPTTMMLRALCDSYMWDVRAEMQTISDVLRGRQARPVVSPEDHARTSEQFRKLADEMIERNTDKTVDYPGLSRDQLVEMAGSEAAFDAIKDAPLRSASDLAKAAQSLVAAHASPK